LEEIFNPFFTTKAAGLGVGLALSRMIVEAHGGRIWAESAQTCGAVFRFTLPRVGEAASLSTERASSHARQVDSSIPPL